MGKLLFRSTLIVVFQYLWIATISVSVFALPRLNAEAQTTELPEIPARLDDLTLIARKEDGSHDYTKPQIPPLRTSADGRIAIPAGGNAQVRLIVPEKLSQPFMLSTPGVTILASSKTIPFDQLHRTTAAAGTFHPSFRTFCDVSTAFAVNGETPNPKTCEDDQGADCYDLKILQFVSANDSQNAWTELWSTPVTVKVTNPKTSGALIESMALGTPEFGARYEGAKSVFEPVVTDDGKLLVARISRSPLTWKKDNGTSVSGLYNMVYSIGSDEYDGCDARQWSKLYPISHAPFHRSLRDAENKPRYGFAAYQFQDSEGTPIPDGAEFRGTYPWIDRRGSNLFFSVVASTLHYKAKPDAVTLSTRFPSRCLPDLPPEELAACDPYPPAAELSNVEDRGPTRGLAFAGLWTRGRTVVLDGQINHLDYGLLAAEKNNRLLQLFQANTGRAAQDQSGWVRAGAGRDTSVLANTTLVESFQAIFNYNRNMFPLSARDVVWIINTGRITTEVAFDDYVNQNALIVTDMVPSLSFHNSSTDPTLNDFVMKYHDGFRQDSLQLGSGFLDPVRMQNAASTIEWNVPAYGAVSGAGSRAEPMALGGVHGRGFWMTGANRIAYDMPAQSISPASRPRFVSLFVDPRFADDAIERMVLQFPDGSWVKLRGRHTLIIRSASGEVRSQTLPIVLPENAWSSLAFSVSADSTRVEVLLNGLTVRSMQFTGAGTVLAPKSGTLTLGAALGPAFRGWTDEFRVFLESPDPELACNYARGTLISLKSDYTGPLSEVSERSPDWVHTRLKSRLVANGGPSFNRFVCYTAYGNHLPISTRRIPANTVSVRENFIFPEGPLAFDSPRPDSTRNSFCLSCHVAGHPATLSIDALKPRAVSMQNDPRRQPFQPQRRMFGNIPEGFFKAGVPSKSFSAPKWGVLSDQWLYPAKPNPTPSPTPTPTPTPIPDSDGDGVNNSAELSDGSNPNDRGSFRERLVSPIFAFWNGFLEMINILELTNTGEEPLEVTVTLYRADGRAGERVVITLAPKSQRDVVLNDLAGFETDAYGMVSIAFSGRLDGRVSFYRYATNGVNTDFAFAIPLAAPSRGLTAVTFNTFQPSTAPGESQLPVTNWLSVANMTPQQHRFVVRKFDFAGRELEQQLLILDGFRRVDVEAGHENPGPSHVGLMTVTPESSSARYLAQLIRYGHAPVSGSYAFAFPLRAIPPNGEPVTAPVTAATSVLAWVEAANLADSPQRALVELFGANGTLIQSWSAYIPARGQTHIEVSAFLGSQTGAVRITPEFRGSIVSQVVTYTRASSGSVEALHPVPLREAFGPDTTGSFNLFLGMENDFRVVNPSDQILSATVITTGPDASGAIGERSRRSFSIPANGSRLLGLEEFPAFGLYPNTYGVLSLELPDGRHAVADVVRRRVIGRSVDLLMPTPVR